MWGKIKCFNPGFDVIILFSLILTLFITQVSFSHPGKIINFGYIEAKEEINKTVYFHYHPQKENIASIRLWGSEKLENNETKHSISTNRIDLEANNSFHKIGPSPTEEITINSDEVNTFVLRISIRPKDFPGIYKGQIFLQEIDSEGNFNEPVLIPVEVEVGPWLNIEKDFSGAFRLNRPINGDYMVKSEVPGKVVVSGNVPWEIHAFLEEDFPYETSINIETYPHPKNFFQVENPKEIQLNRKMSPIASGPPPVKNYPEKTEVEFSLSIDNFTRVPGGIQKFPVVIVAKPIL